MKPKVSPTSPKNTNQQNDQLNKLYGETLHTIEKPNHQRMRPVSLLLLVVLFGFIAGFLAPIILFSYGSKIPIINKLHIFEYPSDAGYFLIGRRSGSEPTAEDVAAIADEIKRSSVQIYEITGDSGSEVMPSITTASTGSGFILTEDGYIVSHRNAIAGTMPHVVVTATGARYAVVSAYQDSASDFVILKIDARSLATLPIARLNALASAEEVLLVKNYLPDRDAFVIKSAIAGFSNIHLSKQPALVQSSDSYYGEVVISDDIPSVFNFSIAYTIDKEAIGIVVIGEEATTIMPFEALNPILSMALSSVPIQRPYLGVHYLDLMNAPIVSAELIKAIDRGALIYSADAVLEPAVEIGSPAERVGLTEGDVITAVDGTPVNSEQNLSQIILQHQPSDLLSLSVIRKNGKEETIKVTLESHE
ncbi:MAG: S1C family serine protease [Patescibacteria group bacterium]|nr:S1C family serine protease [Patescibacteria group bacterium]MDD5715155.1 S1C family serine protease [Patescibacteria group bacterium]